MHSLIVARQLCAALLCMAWLVAFNACAAEPAPEAANPGNGNDQATSVAVEPPAIPTPPPAFEKFLLLPVRVHLLSSPSEPMLTTTLVDDDIRRIFKKVNDVWSQAGISFYLESIVREEAVDCAGYAEAETLRPGRHLLQLRPVAGKSDRMLHVYYIKSMVSNGIYFPPAMFVKDSASLRTVPGGIDEPLPRVTSHEIGHALGLEHRQNNTNLMASGTTGTTLNSAEVELARAGAQKFSFTRSATHVLRDADQAWNSAALDDAKRLYMLLQVVPVDHPARRVVNDRLGVPMPDANN